MPRPPARKPLKPLGSTCAQTLLHLVDPVPQSGSYTLDTPEGKLVSLFFERVDDDTIAVTFSGNRRQDRVFHVSKSGQVTDETGG